MAGWNALVSLVLAGMGLFIAQRVRTLRTAYA
jgi:hypothetical protein